MITRRPFVRLDPERMPPWMCVVAGTGWLGAIALRLPAGDGDLLWQRWLGESILREHAADYSRQELSRSSPLLFAMRAPTIVGLALGLAAVAGAAFAPYFAIRRGGRGTALAKA